YIYDYLHMQPALPRPQPAEQQAAGVMSKLRADFQTVEPSRGTKLPSLKTSEFKSLLQVFKANVLADSYYRPQRYPGRVTLFRTASGPPDSTWGWGDIAANGVALHQIPGHHMNVLRPPQAQILADKLSAYLDKTIPTERPTA